MTRASQTFKVETDNMVFEVYISPSRCINLGTVDDEEYVMHVCGLDDWNKLDEAVRDHLQ